MTMDAAPRSAGRLLIVDDDLALVELVRRMVERRGFQTVTASDANQALEVFARERESIDLVITDLVMSGTDGRAFAEELIRLDPNVRILVSTGYRDTEDISELVALGIKDVVYKPYNSAQLLAKIDQVLAS